MARATPTLKSYLRACKATLAAHQFVHKNLEKNPTKSSEKNCQKIILEIILPVQLSLRWQSYHGKTLKMCEYINTFSEFSSMYLNKNFHELKCTPNETLFWNTFNWLIEKCVEYILAISYIITYHLKSGYNPIFILAIS